MEWSHDLLVVLGAISAALGIIITILEKALKIRKLLSRFKKSNKRKKDGAHQPK